MCIDPLSPNTCLQNQTFFEMDSALNNYTHGGFVGVGPLPADGELQQNYINNLYMQDEIPENILTFWYNTHSYTSEVVFGGIPSGSNSSQFFVLPQEENAPKPNAWTVRIHQATFVNQDKVTDFRAGGARFATLDTGYRYILLPNSDYSAFVVALNQFAPEFDCTDLSLYHCQAPKNSCASLFSKMPNISFVFGDLKFTIPPQGYVFESADQA